MDSFSGLYLLRKTAAGNPVTTDPMRIAALSQPP